MENSSPTIDQHLPENSSHKEDESQQEDERHRSQETTLFESTEVNRPGQLSEKRIIVDWKGPDDPEDPKNWAFSSKWAATAIASSFTFISPVSSTMLAPVGAQITKEFGVTSSILLSMCTSIFVLAYAIGPLFLGPLSEIYGRSRVLQGANLFFLIFNLACGFSRNITEMLVFRFLSGLGGSAPLAVGGGVLGDCWKPEERGMAIAVYSLAPLLGPVIGPVAGAWIGLRTTWRWVLWSVSIADAFIQLAGFFLLRETYGPVLLERKAEQVRKEMNLSEEQRYLVRTRYEEDGSRHWKYIFGRALTRPFVMFVREPIVQLLGLYQAFVYGLMYLVLVTIPPIFQGIYGQSIGIAGLHYISLGLGLGLASQFNARFLDYIYKYFSQKNGGVGKPEFRLPSMIPGTTILPIGLFLFGWTAQKHVFWLVPDIGIVLVGAGVILCFQAIQTYVIDAFPLHAASGLAATAFLRSLCGFGFPLFAPVMYEKVGYGIGGSILAAFAIVFGCPAPWLFWHYGERLRMKSSYTEKKKTAV